jgi:REP element-mobilizing transposase RayT
MPLARSLLSSLLLIMPAQRIYGSGGNGLYCHVYNRGVENNLIFNDEEDYRVFLGYIKEYLSSPADPESSKKVFSIRGRASRGTPHQPKNYFNKIELVAYGLMTNHFHLLLNLKSKDSLQGFIRSLCTRYSMYFNKKHHRTGSLFQGPYKSILIRDEACVLHLTRHLHTHGVSSYPEYVGTRVTPWVKPTAVLSYFAKTKIESLKGARYYKDFVEKYQPGQKEIELLEKISLESMAPQPKKKEPVMSKPRPAPRIRASELLAASGIFLLLLALGVRNIMGSTAEITPVPSPAPLVLSETVKEIKEELSKTMLIVKITDGAESVNIRQEPAISSNKIGEALEGETFEFVSINSGWYEIKFADGSTGFISARYIKIMP